MNGILLVKKEKNMTSFDVCKKVSHILKEKKIGHTGTLDPLASGLLVLTLGKYTKISELILCDDKEYIATAKLNILTNTLDLEGEIIKEDNKKISYIDLNNIINSYKGKYIQEVPLFSAVKVNGMKLYQYARENIDVILPKREVNIKKIELLDYKDDIFTIKCLVSKGCFIRSLIRDIGNSLNTYATMIDLKRTRLSKFDIEDAYSLEDISNNKYKLLDIDDVLDYKVINVDDKLYFKIKNGCSINNNYNIEDYVIFKYNNNVIAIYKNVNNILKSYKNFGGE